MATPRSDLKIAIDELKKKQAPYSELWDYYEGRNELRFASRKLAQVFKDMGARFSENWMSVVVKSATDRMVLQAPVVAKQDKQTKTLGELYEDSGLIHDESAVHECMAVTGEAFVILWKEEHDEKPQAYYHDSRLCHAEYDFANPRRLRFVAKWYSDEAGYVHVTLYYPERIEHYISSSSMQDDTHSPRNASALATIESESAFRPDASMGGVVENIFEDIPVYHFRTTPRRAVSLMQDVLRLQDACDKILSDMMVASEYGAMKQRYVITNANVSTLKNAPNEIWEIPAGVEGEQATSVGQFDATDLVNFLNVLNRLSTSIGVISQTPKHYFYQQGGDPSGESLIAMEAPLTRKIQRLQQTVRPVWQRLFAMLLHQAGEAPPALRDIWVPYEQVETVQPLTDAQVIAQLKQSGLPLATSLKERGWTDKEIAEIDSDRKLIAFSPAEREVQARGAMMVKQIGAASTETLSGEFGYNWTEEQRKIEGEQEAALEQQAKMFEAGVGDAAGAYGGDEQRGSTGRGNRSATARETSRGNA